MGVFWSVLKLRLVAMLNSYCHGLSSSWPRRASDRRQLDAIALGCGPGAFTGVRLGTGLAQGIALALDKPLLPISTLHVLAMRALPDAPRVLATIDARMGEVYAGNFRAM